MSLRHGEVAGSGAMLAREPFQRDAGGRPVIANTTEALYAFGSLIRSCETLLLRLFEQNRLASAAARI